MASENFKKAIKIISQRQQKAKYEASIKLNEIFEKIPRIKQIYQLLAQTSLKLTNTFFSDNFETNELIEQIKNENLKLQREIEILLLQNGYKKDYLDTRFYCSICEDTGYFEGVKCRCLKDLVTELNVTTFNHASNIMSANFKDFSLNYYSDIKDEKTGIIARDIMKRIFEFCTIYADKFHQNAPSVLMMGETGLGKTHLSLSIADVIMHKSFYALYSSSLDLFRTLQNEYFGKTEYDKNTMQIVLEADLVIIDDLGAEFDSQFNSSCLYNIINSRLNMNKPTIINTNMTPTEIERRYSSRVASRLMTMYKCLKFVGKDVRQIKLKNNEF